MMTMITITTVMHNKIVFESNADHRRVRAFKDAWSLPVTWQRWRSHHSIRLIRKPHAAYANITALCLIERELLPIEVLHGGNRNRRPFLTPVTLTLTRWPSYTSLTRRPWRYTACANMNFLRQGFWKLSFDRHTYRQTGPKLLHTSLRGW